MMIDFTKPYSYVGSLIHKSQEARADDARRFFAVAQSLRLCRRGALLKFARYIREGFLSVRDAQDLLNGRLPKEKLRRYQLAKYWISSGFFPEQWFYFNPSVLWPVEKAPESTIPFL